MSVLEANTEENMDSQDWERDEPQCCSEGKFGEKLRSPFHWDVLMSGHVRLGPKVKVNEPQKFSIFDRDQKVLVLDSGILKAVPNKSYIRPETFHVLASPSAPSSEEKGSPIFLAVSKGEFCLCCEKPKGKICPSLQLKKQKLMSLASLKEAELQGYVFYKSQVGSLHTLESAAHQGWFICTSCRLHEPVGVTNKTGIWKHTEFSFVKV
uniref:Interleukin-1 n=1 Tax=Sciurus vulgaris TaxID=55149 RepID=A0A8D2CN20_SCIVU